MPSRMTVSQMFESFFGIEALCDGRRLKEDQIDVSRTQFNSNSGKTQFICGKTGVPLQRPIFFGTVFYFALNHLVQNKCKSRSRGTENILTGQALKGGSRGGLRVGEMERDQLRARISERSECVLNERLITSCDAMIVSVCQNCGFLEPTTSCCEAKRILRVKMSRSTRLMLYEIYAFGIFPRLEVSI